MLSTEQNKCCGCGACAVACPVKCIQMVENADGFSYPVVNTSQCISCGKCNSVCPVTKGFTQSRTPEFYAAYYNKDAQILKDSSSGGVFWPIAHYILEQGGVVYGAYQRSLGKIVHGRADTVETCERFRKSKYLQSDMEDTLPKVRDDLRAGRTVLFSGTPCQVAALKSFLGKDYQNLYTIDVVCHGVPSKKVFDLYLAHVEKEHSSAVVDYCWRDKRFGWGPNRVTLSLADGRSITTTSQDNPMQKGFLKNLYLRESCYECPFARLPRVADISLADFWGYDGELVTDNSNRGLSLVAVSSAAGAKLFDMVKGELTYHEVSKDYACKRARHLHTHPKHNPKHELFMRSVAKGHDFAYLDRRYINPSPVWKAINKISQTLNRATHA